MECECFRYHLISMPWALRPGDRSAGHLHRRWLRLDLPGQGLQTGLVHAVGCFPALARRGSLAGSACLNLQQTISTRPGPACPIRGRQQAQRTTSAGTVRLLQSAPGGPGKPHPAIRLPRQQAGVPIFSFSSLSRRGLSRGSERRSYAVTARLEAAIFIAGPVTTSNQQIGGFPVPKIKSPSTPA